MYNIPIMGGVIDGDETSFKYDALIVWLAVVVSLIDFP